MKAKINFLIVILALLLVGLVVYWKIAANNVKKQGVAPVASHQEATTTSDSAALGAQVYEQSQNPVNDGIPNTNPLENTYKNPFE